MTNGGQTPQSSFMHLLYIYVIYPLKKIVQTFIFHRLPLISSRFSYERLKRKSFTPASRPLPVAKGQTKQALLLPNRSQSYVKCQRKLNLYEGLRIQTFIPKIFGFHNKIVIPERLNHFFEVENTYITMGVRKSLSAAAGSMSTRRR